MYADGQQDTKEFLEVKSFSLTLPRLLLLFDPSQMASKKLFLALIGQGRGD